MVMVKFWKKGKLLVSQAIQQLRLRFLQVVLRFKLIGNLSLETTVSEEVNLLLTKQGIGNCEICMK